MKKLESGDLTTIKNIRKGDLFSFRENGPVYVRDDYDRSEKKYSYYAWDDVNHWNLAKPTRKVFVV